MSVVNSCNNDYLVLIFSMGIISRRPVEAVSLIKPGPTTIQQLVVNFSPLACYNMQDGLKPIHRSLIYYEKEGSTVV